VRGQFRNLSEQTRAYLLATATEHDLFLSSFTQEGTFTYDERLQFFNLRYEVRCATSITSEPGADPATKALTEAETFLRILRIGHGSLKAAVMDMSAMTSRAELAKATEPSPTTPDSVSG
jgi:hypothetical protein